jgi:hypothetical protein
MSADAARSDPSSIRACHLSVVAAVEAVRREFAGMESFFRMIFLSFPVIF